MRIEWFQLLNYKSFRDSGEVPLNPGMNVIVGKNNAGKTAFLEGFRLDQRQSIPFRSSNMPQEDQGEPESTVRLGVNFLLYEIKSLLKNSGLSIQVSMPGQNQQTSYDNIVQIFLGESISGNVSWSRAANFQKNGRQSYKRESGYNETRYFFNVRVDRQDNLHVENLGLGDNDNFIETITGSLWSKIYIFNAERLNVPTFPATEGIILASNASNLAACLNHMQGNPVQMQKFCAHVSSIFSNIAYISVETTSQTFNIKVWMHDIQSQRPDLSFHLKECGTGVGQVLAILYVVMTAPNGVIIIDEPGSFLHPGAARKLIEIIKSYDRHQYIISTHSADLIAAAGVDQICHVTWSDGESRVKVHSSNEFDNLRLILSDLGVSFTDIFGHERVVWVEGETEEACFPLIAEHAGFSAKVIWRRVAATGDFSPKQKRRNREIIQSIYQRLSNLNTLMPVAVGFSFDREGLTTAAMKDLQQQSGGRIKFISRRTYENYLLSPNAIASVASDENGFGTFTEQQITGWIEAYAKRQGYNAEGSPLGDVDWLKDVDAPKLLSTLFAELSEARVEYRKTRHSRLLTQWMLQNEPSNLDELVEHVKALVANG